MTIAQPLGGHSSNRQDGPAGIRGLKIADVPMNAKELTVDLEELNASRDNSKPKLVTLGASMTLFPFPIKEMAAIVKEWGGRIFFDGAHQLGLMVEDNSKSFKRRSQCHDRFRREDI